MVFVIVFLALLLCSFLEAPLGPTFNMILNMCLRENSLDCRNSSTKDIYIFICHIPLIFLESESICFGASTPLILIIAKNGKYLLINNLHVMGRKRKEIWDWYFFIKFTFDGFRTWPRAPIHGLLGTVCIVLSSLLTMTSIITHKWRNASSNIFRTAPASILLELTSKFFGKSCYSTCYPILTVAI